MKTCLLLVVVLAVLGLGSARPDASLDKLHELLEQSASEINDVILSLNEDEREVEPVIEEGEDVEEEVKKEFEELTAMGLPPPPDAKEELEELGIVLSIERKTSLRKIIHCHYQTCRLVIPLTTVRFMLNSGQNDDLSGH